MNNNAQLNDTQQDISIEAGRKTAPIGDSLKRALHILRATGRFSLLAIVIMTVVRGLLSALQVSAIAGMVASVSSSNGYLTQFAVIMLVQLAVAIIGAYVLDNVMKYVSDR